MIKRLVINNRFLRNSLRWLLGSPFLPKKFYIKKFNEQIQREIPKYLIRPTSVSIENTSYCNSSCVFCFQSIMKRERGFMSKETYANLIKQLSDWGIEEIMLHGYGEPLLDKDYANKVRFAKEMGIKRVLSTTNGVLMNPLVSEGLVKSGLDMLHVSIDAADPKTYGEIHRVNSSVLYVVLENIKKMHEIKQRLNSKTPFVQLKFRQFDKNKGEEARFIKQFRQYCDQIMFQQSIFPWWNAVTGNVPTKRVLRFPCFYLYGCMTVLWDGRVMLCCADYDGDYTIGNINDTNIKELWNCAKMNEVRKWHNEGTPFKFPLCTQCARNTQYVTPWWA
jgi:radical SAM protein with 4Fe4S-binding SPASM domain